MIATFRDEVTRPRAAEHAKIDEGWVLLHKPWRWATSLTSTRLPI
jgi:hypothetical protein